jgi:putative flippase GtrA
MKYYKKYKEIINYLIVGGLTTVLALAVYYGSVLTFLDPDNSIQLQIANILSWVAGVTFAYFTNRKFVFESKAENKLKEAGSFVLSRLITLFMDMAIMFVGVTVLHGNDKIMKLISQVVITISNYIFSKVFVFKKKNSKENNTVTEVQ